MSENGNSFKLPKKDEWTLLYEHQREEYQRNQALQKQKEKLRKIAFKQTLDRHLSEKKDQKLQEKIQDHKYYQHILESGRRMKQLQQRNRIQRILKRRAIEEANKSILNQYSKVNIQKVVPIGLPTNIEEIEYQNKREQFKKKFVSELNLQLNTKEKEKQQRTIEQMIMMQKNAQYQKRKQSERTEQLQKNKNYSQNMEVYNHFIKLEQQKKRKQQQLNKKLIQQAALLKRRQQQQKQMREEYLKQKNTEEMKDSLLEQIEKHNNMKTQRKQQGPNLYSPLEKIFQQKQKRKIYDKNEYANYLKLQQQQHKHKKKSDKYMSEEQYKMNFNQLHKIVNGEYPNVNYSDRSPTNIGNPQEISRKKDEFYFNKLSPSKQYSPVTSTRSHNTSNIFSSNKNQQDINLIKDKLSYLRNYNILANP